MSEVEFKSVTGPVIKGSVEWLDLVRGLVGSLNYGAVQIVVHDARVMQVERTEKVRLASRVKQSVNH